MRVVVLGGTWFVGRAICAELAVRGHELLVVHRGLSEPSDLVPARHLHAEQDRLEFVLRRVRAARARMPFGAGTFLFSRIYVGDVATAVAAVFAADDAALKNAVVG